MVVSSSRLCHYKCHGSAVSAAVGAFTVLAIDGVLDFTKPPLSDLVDKQLTGKRGGNAVGADLTLQFIAASVVDQTTRRCVGYVRADPDRTAVMFAVGTGT